MTGPPWRQGHHLTGNSKGGGSNFRAGGNTWFEVHDDSQHQRGNRWESPGRDGSHDRTWAITHAPARTQSNRPEQRHAGCLRETSRQTLTPGLTSTVSSIGPVFWLAFFLVHRPSRARSPVALRRSRQAYSSGGCAGMVAHWMRTTAPDFPFHPAARLRDWAPGSNAREDYPSLLACASTICGSAADRSRPSSGGDLAAPPPCKHWRESGPAARPLPNPAGPSQSPLRRRPPNRPIPNPCPPSQPDSYRARMRLSAGSAEQTIAMSNQYRKCHRASHVMP